MTKITRKGYDYLQAELEDLKVRLQEAMDALEQFDDEAGEDEGAEFDVESDREYLTERIDSITAALNNAEIVDGRQGEPGVVALGKRITVKQGGEEWSFDLVSGVEVAHGVEGVSDDSPVGKALLGKTIGNHVTVQVPDGEAEYTILNVEAIRED